MNTLRCSTIQAVALVVVGVGIAIGPAPAHGTAFDDYVAAPDSNYSFSVVSSTPGADHTTHVLDMTSQQWRTAAEVDRPVWQHWLIIVVPDTVVSDIGLLFIDGGSNGGSAPTTAESFLVGIALSTQTVVAQLRMVPNERLKFTDETDPRYIENGRTEDEIIAYTFDKYLTTGDETWPLLLPMAKSAVRGMDTVQTYVSPAVSVNQFVVSGASKRGWTTWLTAAVDSRVVAIIPVVIDMLNLDLQMEHHFSSYGFYAPAIGDYDVGGMDVLSRLATPEGQALLTIVDPYDYRNRYASVPKFMINATGDEFFVPDSAQFHFHDLPGEKFLRYVPNTDHSLASSDAVDSLGIFYAAVLNGLARPRFSWTVEADQSIRVQTVTPPDQVNLWQATNPNERLFMKDVIGSAWTNSALGDTGGGVYVGQVPAPAQGWTAYFVELVYNTTLGTPFKFTTEIVITPDILPFPQSPDCNHNRFSDPLDIVNGTSSDDNGDGIPDECQSGVPTVSAWGLLVLALVVAAVGARVIVRWRSPCPVLASHIFRAPRNGEEPGLLRKRSP